MVKKNKDKITFDKRGFKTSPIGTVMASVMGTLGGAAEAKKSATIIRLINHWPEIIGKDMAAKTAPLKITYKYQKNRETGENDQIMVLKMKAEGALGTTIAMRQTIILDRLNRLFGTDKFQKLDIIHGSISVPLQAKPKKIDKHYDIDLPEMDDALLKSRLESLGQAVMNSNKDK
jgi:hypothetical protein